MLQSVKRGAVEVNIEQAEANGAAKPVLLNVGLDAGHAMTTVLLQRIDEPFLPVDAKTGKIAALLSSLGDLKGNVLAGESVKCINAIVILGDSR